MFNLINKKFVVFFENAKNIFPSIDTLKIITPEKNETEAFCELFEKESYANQKIYTDGVFLEQEDRLIIKNFSYIIEYHIYHDFYSSKESCSLYFDSYKDGREDCEKKLNELLKVKSEKKIG